MRIGKFDLPVFIGQHRFFASMTSGEIKKARDQGFEAEKAVLHHVRQP